MKKMSLSSLKKKNAHTGTKTINDIVSYSFVIIIIIISEDVRRRFSLGTPVSLPPSSVNTFRTANENFLF